MQRYLAEKFQSLVKVSPEEVASGMNADEKSKIGECQQQIADAKPESDLGNTGRLFTMPVRRRPRTC